MKIIKKASKPNSMMTVCKNCGSILEVTIDDVTPIMSRSGGTEYTYQCPVCDRISYDKELKQLFEYHTDIN